MPIIVLLGAVVVWMHVAAARGLYRVLPRSVRWAVGVGLAIWALSAALGTYEKRAPVEAASDAPASATRVCDGGAVPTETATTEPTTTPPRKRSRKGVR